MVEGVAAMASMMPTAPMDTETMSRESSAPTQVSAQPQQQMSNGLTGIANLATAVSATSSPQQRPVAIAPAMYPPGTSPASTHPGVQTGHVPTCQNCQTSTTPLWRRDETGAVLCNACGLFLKLHSRPRPISLKTDVIKSRNRVKTVRPELAKQKKQNQGLAGNDANGADFANSARRNTHQSPNGNDTNSPISRTGTPNMYGQTMHPVFSGLQDLNDPYQTQHLANFGGPGASPGRAGSPMNGDRMDQNDILQQNSTLKTRVSELEVIQELYRGRIQQLEQEETNRQQAQDAVKADEQLLGQVAALNEHNAQLQKDLDESHHRENVLKRRLDELEVELKDAKSSLEVHESNRSAKRARVDDGPAESNDEASAPTLDA